ncbi:MAG: MerR family transcriptional regulator, partial [Deltaproteobacteria bacterium]|nr:MerR family transcriptional regulator [Deltaproteobacteria bacterium]
PTSAGALPSRTARPVAFYGPRHVERLELIGRLQDRGLRMRAIKELVDRIESGELQLNEWLGLEEQLQAAWVDDAPQVLTLAEITQLVGELRPGSLAELVRQGFIVAHGEGRYLVHSPGLLQVAGRLEKAGISLDVITGAWKIMQKHMQKAALELVGLFGERAGEGFGQGRSLESVAEAFKELKPLGLESVRLIFAREMEQALRKLVESGEATRIERSKRRRGRG